MPRVKKTRVLSSDVGRYQHMNTGTAGAPQKQSAKLSSTRVTSGSVTSHPVTGEKQSARVKGTRVKKY